MVYERKDLAILVELNYFWAVLIAFGIFQKKNQIFHKFNIVESLI
jgi:hypothetical protein